MTHQCQAYLHHHALQIHLNPSRLMCMIMIMYCCGQKFISTYGVTHSVILTVTVSITDLCFHALMILPWFVCMSVYHKLKAALCFIIRQTHGSLSVITPTGHRCEARVGVSLLTNNASPPQHTGWWNGLTYLQYCMYYVLQIQSVYFFTIYTWKWSIIVA